ncbi:hypothetical protein MP638_002088 [Amoeboaphelidium occidentale]|nr:hypothetical protein MP638_002088 [Amoeboaphelidium occidentale]
MKISCALLLVCSFVYGAPSRQNYQELYATLDEIETISPFANLGRPIFLVAGGTKEGMSTITESLIKKSLPRSDINALTPTMITLKHAQKENFTLKIADNLRELRYSDYQGAFDQLKKLMNAEHQDTLTPFHLGIHGVEHSYLTLVDFKGLNTINDDAHKLFKRYKDKYASHKVIAVSSCDRDVATSIGYQLWNEKESTDILVITNTHEPSCSGPRKQMLNRLCESNDNVFIMPIHNEMVDKNDKSAKVGMFQRFSKTESFEFAGECKDKNRFGVASLRARLEEISYEQLDAPRTSKLRTSLENNLNRARKDNAYASKAIEMQVIGVQTHLTNINALLKFSLGVDSSDLNTKLEHFDHSKLHHLSSASEFLFKAFKSYVYYTIPGARLLQISPEMDVNSIVGGNDTDFAKKVGEAYNSTLISPQLLNDTDILDIYPAYQPFNKSESITVASPENPLRLQILQIAKQIQNIAKVQSHFHDSTVAKVQQGTAVEQWKIIAEKYVESLVVMATRVFQENIEDYANNRFPVKDQSGNEVKLGSEWVQTFKNSLIQNQGEVMEAIRTYTMMITSGFAVTDTAYQEQLATSYETFFKKMYFPELHDASIKEKLKRMGKEKKDLANTEGSSNDNSNVQDLDVVIPTKRFPTIFAAAEKMKTTAGKGSNSPAYGGNSIAVASTMFDKTKTFIAEKYEEFTAQQEKKDQVYNAARQKLFDDIENLFPTLTQGKFVTYLAEQTAYLNIRAHDFIDMINLYIYSKLLEPAVEGTRTRMEQRLKFLFPSEQIRSSVTPEMQNTLDRYNKIIELTQKAMQLMPNM